MSADEDMRPGEVAALLPERTDAGVYFIGRIKTPWPTRADCPKRGDPSGPSCFIEVDPRWLPALQGLETHSRIQVLYWMHQSRRDLVLQRPRGKGTVSGTFSIRSPVRPNPIASSEVDLVTVAGCVVTVRGLDCIDGTPLIDLKPVRPAGA
jgi:tRNA-Thr(GGU) m(6)t(6)A37 methyltransferase TsaA